MSKASVIIGVAMLIVGLAGGYAYSVYFAPLSGHTSADAPEREPLFYRNPMNPSVTSPVPAKDSMGMDYVPVYADEKTPPQEREVLFYRSPMNPSVTSPVPAKDSMGMDYIPVFAEEGQDHGRAGTVSIDPVVVQNIGVRTAVARRETLSRAVRAVGRVAFDEENLFRLHPKIEGWVEQIRVDKTGQTVREDEILLSIYSPKLVTAQQEYLLALNGLEVLRDSPFEDIRQGAEELAQSSRYRLTLLDVPEHQIQELEADHKIKKRLHIHAPQAGTVIAIGARAGQHVTPNTELYSLVDLRQVWVYADIYDYEIPWVQIGDEVEMTLASVPGRTFKGTVSYIYPYAEARTRTTKVRLVFDNDEQLLRPDMLADVVIESDRRENAIVVPSEAIVRSGKRTLMFVQREPGKFEPREVTLGLEADGLVAVSNGIAEGEEVVTSAQFLLDSESKLLEATAKMLETGVSGRGNRDTADGVPADAPDMNAHDGQATKEPTAAGGDETHGHD